jgi:NADH-quinone oxidoreductase subunit M
MPDLSVREWGVLGPIELAVLWMGIYPESFIRPMRNDVGRLMTRLEHVAPAGDSQLRIAGPQLKVIDAQDRGAHH